MNNGQAGSKNRKRERRRVVCVCVWQSIPFCLNYAAKFLLSSVSTLLFCFTRRVSWGTTTHTLFNYLGSAHRHLLVVVAFEARAVLNIKINRKQGHIPCACASLSVCVCVCECVCVRYTQNHCRCVVRNVLNRAHLIHSRLLLSTCSKMCATNNKSKKFSHNLNSIDKKKKWNKKREIREIKRKIRKKQNETKQNRRIQRKRKRITTKRKALTKIFLKYTTLHTYIHNK